MQRLAVFLVFLLIAGCASQAPWEKIDYDRQAEAYTNLGMGYLEQGQISRALRDFRKALDARPSYTEALHGTALALQQQGEAELSETYFKQALQAKGSKTDIRNNYAAFLFNQNRYAAAHQQLTLASQDIYYADRSSVFFNLGYVALKQNQLKAAATYLQQSLVLEPRAIRPHLALLEVRSKQQEWQQAEHHWLFLRDAQVNDKATLKKALIVVQNTGNQKEVRYINSLLSDTH